jgi:hypothetical protein
MRGMVPFTVLAVFSLIIGLFVFTYGLPKYQAFVKSIVYTDCMKEVVYDFMRLKENLKPQSPSVVWKFTADKECLSGLVFGTAESAGNICNDICDEKGKVAFTGDPEGCRKDCGDCISSKSKSVILAVPNTPSGWKYVSSPVRTYRERSAGIECWAPAYVLKDRNGNPYEELVGPPGKGKKYYSFTFTKGAGDAAFIVTSKEI